MGDRQPLTTATGPKRGILARPLDALVFLLPLILFYELAVPALPDRVIAFDLLRRFFELFGQVGMWAPGLAVIAILLATHLLSGQDWSVRWSRVGLMYVEAVVAAVPLLALNWAIPLGSTSLPASRPDGAQPLLGQMALSIGAGVYEELVFRLILVSVVVMIGVDLIGFRRTAVAAVAILLSALMFAAHHHPPIGAEPFDLTRFAFRALAGGYLAVIFWYRGYGSAAGCHAAYNVVLVAAGVIGIG